MKVICLNIFLILITKSSHSCKTEEERMQNYGKDVFLNHRVVGEIKITIYKIYYSCFDDDGVNLAQKVLAVQALL